MRLDYYVDDNRYVASIMSLKHNCLGSVQRVKVPEITLYPYFSEILLKRFDASQILHNLFTFVFYD